MNLTIEIPDESAARYRRLAEARGLTVERWMLEVADSAATPATDTKNLAEPTEGDDSGAALLAVLQNSPHPEIDLAPPRDRMPVQVRDIVL